MGTTDDQNAVTCKRRPGPKPGSARVDKNGRGNGGCAKASEYVVASRPSDVVSVDKYDNLSVASAVSLDSDDSQLL